MQQVGALNPSVTSTTSTKLKVSLANKNRSGGDLEKIYWMHMSMCLQIYLSYLMLQQRGTRSICSWESRNTGLETAAGGAVLAVTIKALLMLLGFFFGVTATVRLHYFFPPYFFFFPPLPKNSSESQFCWAVLGDHSKLPSTPNSRSCTAAAGWPPALL